MNSPEVQQHLTDIRTISSDLKALEALLPAAYAAQWERSPVPRSREDTGERSHGGPPSDPTADVALDERRLALREAVTRFEAFVRYAAVGAASARERLDRALADWEGLE